MSSSSSAHPLLTLIHSTHSSASPYIYVLARGDDIYQRFVACLRCNSENRLAFIEKYGNYLYCDGRWDEAEAIFVVVLANEEKMRGEEDSSSLVTVAWLAAICRSQYWLQMAEQLQVEVLETHQTKLGTDPAVASRLPC